MKITLKVPAGNMWSISEGYLDAFGVNSLPQDVTLTFEPLSPEEPLKQKVRSLGKPVFFKLEWINIAW